MKKKMTWQYTEKGRHIHTMESKPFNSAHNFKWYFSPIMLCTATEK
jgi:hypothetical protein